MTLDLEELSWERSTESKDEERSGQDGKTGQKFSHLFLGIP